MITWLQGTVNERSYQRATILSLFYVPMIT